MHALCVRMTDERVDSMTCVCCTLIMCVHKSAVSARAAREKFPYSVECKNQEKLNVWDAYEQAKENCNGYEPIVVMKKNRKQPLVVIDAEHFISLCSRIGYNK